MSLRELLDSTIEEPSPPFVDVDHVVARARRSQWRRRVVGTAAVMVAVVALPLGALAVQGLPDRSTQPAVNFDDLLFERRDPGLIRLTGVVRAAVEEEVPDVVWRDDTNSSGTDDVEPDGDPNWAARWTEPNEVIRTDVGVDVPAKSDYEASAAIAVGDLTGELTIEIRLLGEYQSPCNLYGSDCDSIEGPNGENVVIQWDTDGPEMSNRADLVRDDGKVIELTARNAAAGAPASGESVPLTTAQLAQVVLRIAAQLDDETPAAARERLSEAMAAAVRHSVPRANLLDSFTVTGGPPYRGEALVDADGPWRMSITVGEQTADAVECRPAEGCLETSHPSVERILARTRIEPVAGSAAPRVTHWVVVDRHAGDQVVVEVTSEPSGGHSAADGGLSRDEAIAIGLNATLTLYA